jgi:hypothetical protein
LIAAIFKILLTARASIFGIYIWYIIANFENRCVISGFCRVVDENCAFLGYYQRGSVPFQGPKCLPETSVRNFQYSLRNNPEERRSPKTETPILSVSTAIYYFKKRPSEILSLLFSDIKLQYIIRRGLSTGICFEVYFYLFLGFEFPF